MLWSDVSQIAQIARMVFRTRMGRIARMGWGAWPTARTNSRCATRRNLSKSIQNLEKWWRAMVWCLTDYTDGTDGFSNTNRTNGANGVSGLRPEILQNLFKILQIYSAEPIEN